MNRDPAEDAALNPADDGSSDAELEAAAEPLKEEADKPRERLWSSSRRKRLLKRRRLWAIAVVGGTVLAALLVVYVYRAVFGPLFFALALAYLFEPVVGWLEQRKFSRGGAVAVILAVFGGFALLLVSLLVTQGMQLVEWLKDGDISTGLAEAVTQVKTWLREVLPGGFGDELREGSTLPQLAEQVMRLVTAVLGTVVSSFAFLAGVLLVPIYLVYLMLGLPRLWRRVQTLLPAADRERELRALHKIHLGLASFLRGRVVIAVIKGVLTAIGLVIVGAPLPLVVGLGAGLLYLLPFLGPFVGFVVAVGLSLAEFGSAGSAIGPPVEGAPTGDTVLGVIGCVGIVFVVAEFVEGYILTPKIMKDGINMHPLTVVFSFVFWTAALGLFGTLVAIPLTLILRVVLEEYVLPSVRELAERE